MFTYFFFLGASLLLSEEDAEVPVDSNGLILSGPALWLARKRFSHATARRDNTVPRHSKPFFVCVCVCHVGQKQGEET